MEDGEKSNSGNLSIGAMIGIGGLIIGAGNLYLRWREDNERKKEEAKKEEGGKKNKDSGEEDEDGEGSKKENKNKKRFGME